MGFLNCRQNCTKMPGVSVKDVDQHEFVKALGAFLKKSGKMRTPEWTDIVKTGVYKELAPYDDDWYYIRGASMARHLYIRSPCGVGAFTTVYGGSRSRGTAPSHFCKASLSVCRRILQALGDMDRIASQIVTKTKNSAAAAAAAAAADQ